MYKAIELIREGNHPPYSNYSTKNSAGAWEICWNKECVSISVKGPQSSSNFHSRLSVKGYTNCTDTKILVLGFYRSFMGMIAD